MSTATQAPTQALATTRTSPLIGSLAERWQMNAITMLDTLKATVFPQKDRNNVPIIVTNEQMIAFLQVANEYRLNPFLKELYAFPTKGGGIVPMVPVDGWANIVNRNQYYDGVEFKDEWFVPTGKQPHEKALFSTTCTIYRKDRGHPTVVTEYMQECFQPNKEPWTKWPARMLRHKAFIQCARIAFSLAGIYDPDEAERIAESEDGKPNKIERPKVIEASQNLDTHTSESTSAQQATDTKTCLCNCCKAGKCDCQGKSEFDRCGCSACVFAVKNPAQEEKAEEQAKAEVDRGNPNQPTGDELFGNQDKPVETKYRTDVKKLMAIAKSAYGVKDYEAKVHEVLKSKFGIESLKQIPVEKYEEICEVVGQSIKTR